jgi:hypothetical protein
MKRQAGLLDLSREHHAALVWAVHAQRGGAEAELLAGFSAFRASLATHFAEEECRLPGCVPPAALATMLDDHRRLEALGTRIAGGDASALPEFGALLAGHVRFEERTLFPAWVPAQRD